MSDAELLAAYRATSWTVRLPDGEVGLRIAERFPATRGHCPAGIVTAYNPASALCSEEENRAAQARLRAALERAGAVLHPTVAWGTGPDAARWTEPGFWVEGLPLDDVVEQARAFGQNAIVWVDAHGVPTLVAARSGFCGARPGELL